MRAAVVAVLLIAAFSEPGRQAAGLGKPFELKPGEVVTVDGTALRVGFEGVSQDSRCPVGVTCIWEGDAAITLTLEKPPAARQTRVVHTSSRYERDTEYEGFVIRLQDLRPQPAEGKTITPEQYRATLLVDNR